MTFKNKHGEIAFSTIIIIILGVAVLVWAFWGPITKLILGQKDVTSTLQNACTQANGACLDSCSGGRIQLVTGTGVCPKNEAGNDQVCCTKLATDGDGTVDTCVAGGGTCEFANNDACPDNRERLSRLQCASPDGKDRICCKPAAP